MILKEARPVKQIIDFLKYRKNTTNCCRFVAKEVVIRLYASLLKKL